MTPRAIKQVSYDLSGQTVLVTGAARGQGRVHALSFAAAGADVAIVDIDADVASVPYPLARPEDLQSLATEIEDGGSRCVAVTCDVRDAEQIRSMVAEVEDGLGTIDVLINNAGVESVYAVTEMPESAWDDVLDTNLRGAFLCAKYIAPGMIEQGRGKIVNTSSVLGLVALPKNAHYTAAKHGLLGLTKALAIELAPHGINVNAVCPGAIDTPMNDGLLARHEDWMAGLGPLSGTWNLFAEGPDAPMLGPEEITQAMLWLASDASDFVTGTAIVVDAGAVIK
jgi:NAD(P)-dependent dehydrogenase (short-subunit alcohol dehydrogenase family)